MRNIKLILLLLICQYASAQTQYEFSLKTKHENYKYKIASLDTEFPFKDSGVVKGNVVYFRGKLNYSMPAMVMVEGGEKNKVFTVFLEPGVHIYADANDNFSSIEFSGSSLQQQFNNWNNTMSPYKKKIDDAFEEYRTAQKNNNKELAAQFYQQVKKAKTAMEGAQKDWLKNNHPSVFNGLILLELFDFIENHPAEALQVYEKLDAAAKAHPLIMRIGDDLRMLASVAPGNQFMHFSLPDTSNVLISTEGYKGKYVLVDFWASWCIPCRAESPYLVEAYNKYSGKGFDIIGVSFDKNKNAWKKAIAKDGFTWSNVIDDSGFATGTISQKLVIRRIPRNFLLDREGKVVAVNLRGEDLDDTLSKMF